MGIAPDRPSPPGYRLPPAEVVEILDAPPTPIVRVSPRRDAMLLVDYRPHPDIAFVARPFLRLAGLRIDPRARCRKRLGQHTRLSVLWIRAGRRVEIEAPRDGSVGVPVWSHDGARLAFTRDLPDGVELWVADSRTGRAGPIPGVRLNDILTHPFDWMSDNLHLRIQMIPADPGRQPAEPAAPHGPVVEETSGRFSKVWTHQDLLKDPHDEDLFEHLASSQTAVVNPGSGEVRLLGRPGLFMDPEWSPDERFLLVTRLHRPFSYQVPCDDFARTVEVWDRAGEPRATIADLPVSDEVPPQGVPTGPREVMWQPLHGARLLWVEALDGGDPTKKVPHRDRLMRLSEPFAETPAEVLRIRHRFSNLDWTARAEEALLWEYDRDRRWRTVTFLSMADPDGTRKVIHDLSARDAYRDPGRPVYDVAPDGERLLLQDGDWTFWSAAGASETGEHPTLDRLNLATLEKERLFRSAEDAYEGFLCFAGGDRDVILTRRETRTEPPNYFLLRLSTGERTALTAFPDPAPRLTGMRKELVRYRRKDGVGLSGTLYLPPDHRDGDRLPLVIWAYPLEYSDPDTAGQVRGSPNTFPFLRGSTPLFFCLRGYAVLMDATMPVVGDPETMNDTYVEQVVGAAEAAVDRLDEMGVIDPARVCVAGHSYGAFMTANVLAHSDRFAAGIARSGAYNRTLTPFGFQSERRSFWEAPATYLAVSPFAHADRIKKPLLLIHGQADNNSGTHTVQSERLYQAIKGNGGTARLVLLPCESHGYTARESVLHVLAEMLDWADRFVKDRKAEPAGRGSA